jgi:Zn-dependent peptidase ImmA (M78 family)
MRARTPRVARPKAQVELAQRYLEQPDLARAIGTSGAVDLARVARAQNVHTIELRPLLAEGCLIPDTRGFTVQVNHSERTAIDPTITTLKETGLTTRQRFTIAHEIAHTLVYDLTRTPPREHPGKLQAIFDTSEREPAKSLEDFCQISAGMILTPTVALEKELGPFGCVDSIEVVLRLAETFRVSPEMLIHRVGQIDGMQTRDYALLMVTGTGGVDQVRAYTYSWTLRPFFDPPKRYALFRPWIKRAKLPIAIADSHQGKWDVIVHGGVLQVKKTRHRYGASFFIEVRFE